MAAEVHDSLAQSIMFVKMRLALLDDALAAADIPRASGYTRELRAVASETHATLRTLITHFRQDVPAAGLVQALRVRLERLGSIAGLPIELSSACADLELEPSRAAEVYAVVMEAASNVVQHAHASRARVTLREEGTPGWCEALVEDDGRGVATAADNERRHYGLEIMNERARRLGGRLDVTARDGGGTRVRLAFPRHAPTEAHD